MNRSTYQPSFPAHAPNMLVWQDEYRVPLVVQRPTIPDGTINDRKETNSRFQAEYNPYFYDKYKYRNLY